MWRRAVQLRKLACVLVTSSLMSTGSPFMVWFTLKWWSSSSRLYSFFVMSDWFFFNYLIISVSCQKKTACRYDYRHHSRTQLSVIDLCRVVTRWRWQPPRLRTPPLKWVLPVKPATSVRWPAETRGRWARKARTGTSPTHLHRCCGLSWNVGAARKYLWTDHS